MVNNKNNLIVNSIYSNIKKNYKSLYQSYQFKTKNQKYKLKFILKACVYFISISCSFKNFNFNNLNSNTFYKNYMKLNKFKISYPFRVARLNLHINFYSINICLNQKIKLNKYILILVLFIINIILIKLKEINILKIKKL